MDCEQAGIELVAQALDGREGAADTPLAVHLRDCPDCRFEQEANASVLAMLPTVAEYELDGVPVPDPERAIAYVRRTAQSVDRPAQRQAEPGPLTASAHDRQSIAVPSSAGSVRRPRKAVFVLAAAFAAVALTGGGIVVGAALPSDSAGGRAAAPTAASSGHAVPSGGVSVVRGEGPGNGVAASVEIRPKRWGTEAQLTLGGLRGPLTCHLVAVDASGMRSRIADWSVPPRGYGVPGSPDPLVVTASSSLNAKRITAFEVLTTTGHKLVSLHT